MIYEIVNPSDMVTIDAPNRLLATLAVVILGNGKYGGTCLDDDVEDMDVPLFLFGGCEEFMQEQFKSTLDEAFAANKKEVGAVLNTALLGDKKDRASYNKGIELIPKDKQKEWRDHWHDDRRSSMNDICAYAWQVAENIAA